MFCQFTDLWRNLTPASVLRVLQNTSILSRSDSHSVSVTKIWIYLFISHPPSPADGTFAFRALSPKSKRQWFNTTPTRSRPASAPLALTVRVVDRMVTTRSGRPYGSDGDATIANIGDLHDTGQNTTDQGGTGAERDRNTGETAIAGASPTRVPSGSPHLASPAVSTEIQPVSEPESALPAWLLQGGTLRERMATQRSHSDTNVGGEVGHQAATSPLGRPPPRRHHKHCTQSRVTTKSCCHSGR